MGEELTQGPLAVRRAGVLLHVTSLPSAEAAPTPAPAGAAAPSAGHGDLGAEAYRFVDFLATAGCTVWQVLPLVPTHETDRSPYNALSAMAGNPDLLSRERCAEQGLSGPAGLGGDRLAAFLAWCEANAAWLDAYVEFVALRDLCDRVPWPSWERGLRDRDPERVAEVLAPHAARMLELRFDQWVFALQWGELRAYAAARGVLVFGDLPIFVSHDSADVWASRELFELDGEGRPTTVSGVPPDYFAADGQRWNNPHYDWDAMAADGFAWWRLRIARQRELFDLVRIDHFRGFEAAWHVPVEARTAKEGRWVQGPARAVLAALVETAGPGTLVAEDLGVITDEVDELRLAFGLPGMKVLQFAFDGEEDNPYLPERHGELSVVYTGTHDNDTTLGWWAEADADTRARVAGAVPVPGLPVPGLPVAGVPVPVPDELTESMPWPLIHLAMASTARLAVVPAQDLLELGSGSRMNTPGSAEDNWGWQAAPGAFQDALSARVRRLVTSTSRLVPHGA